MRCKCPDWSRPFVRLATSEAAPHSRNSWSPWRRHLLRAPTPQPRLGAQVGNLLFEDHRLVTHRCHILLGDPTPID